MSRFNLLLMSLLIPVFSFGQNAKPSIELYVNQKLWAQEQAILLKDKPKIQLKVQDNNGTHFVIDKVEIWSAEADTLPLGQEGSIRLMKKDASKGVGLPLPLDLKSGSIAEYRINKLYRKEEGEALKEVENSMQVVKIRFE
ncbi:MAG: hypothetical protein ACKVTZ_04445 [Bacteroidia bacterium]